jgi:hypothetical protein
MARQTAISFPIHLPDAGEIMPPSQSHRWLEPLWVRLLIVLLLIAALVVEIVWLKEQLWLFLWAAALAYAIWDFFLRGFFNRSKPTDGGT